MSRITLDGKYKDREVVIGLDKMTQSWFYQYWDTSNCDKCGAHMDDGSPIKESNKLEGCSRNELLQFIELYALQDERTKAATRAIVLDLDPEDFVSGYYTKEKQND